VIVITLGNDRVAATGEIEGKSAVPPPNSALYSWISRLILCLLAIPIAVTITLSDLAVRPCFPITFPMSAGSTETRRELPSVIGTDSTFTFSG